MMIIIITAIILCGGIVLLLDGRTEELGMGLTAIGSITMIVFLIMFAIIPLKIKGQIQRYYSIESTLKIARENESVENTALQLKVIETNEWLASTQYYNSTTLGLWIPDKIDELIPLK